MPQEFYNEEEAEQILRLATQQSVTGGLSREALLRTAAEVGLTEAQVVAAEAQLREATDQQSLAERFRLRQRAKFVQEVLSFVGVNAFMFGIWWMGGRGYFWPGWVLVAMGVGALDEIPKRLIPASSSYQKSFARWKAKGAPDVETDDEDEDEDGRRRHRHRRRHGRIVVGVSRHRD